LQSRVARLPGRPVHADALRGDLPVGDRAEGEPRGALAARLPRSGSHLGRPKHRGRPVGRTDAGQQAARAAGAGGLHPAGPGGGLTVRPAGAGQGGAEAMAEARFHVFRGDAKHGDLVTYQVPITEGMVVLDGIHYIQAHLDGTLACRWNCKAAKCGSCSAEVSARPRLMCKTRVDEFGARPITVRPIKVFPLIKDLVTDVSWNYRVNQQIP